MTIPLPTRSTRRRSARASRKGPTRVLAALVAAQAVSAVGDRAMLLVLPVWVRDLSHNDSLAAAVFPLLAVPWLFGPVFGRILDRRRHLNTLIAINAVMACSILPLLLVRHSNLIAVVFAVALAYGIGDVCLATVQSATVGAIIERSKLVSANGLLQSSREAARLVGPLGGAALYAAAGPQLVVLLDVLSFLLAAALYLSVLRENRAPAPPTAPTERRAGRLRALRVILADPILRPVIGVTALAMLAIGAFVPALLAYVVHGLHRAPAYLGALTPVQAAGSVLAGFVVGRLGRWAQSSTLLLSAGLTCYGAGVAVLLPSTLWMALVGMFLIGVGIAMAVVAETTALQSRVAQEIQGEVYGMAQVITTVPQLAAMAAAAALVDIVSFRTMLQCICAGCAVGAAALLGSTWRDARAGSPVSSAGSVSAG